MTTNAMTTTNGNTTLDAPRDDYQGLTMVVSPAEALKRVQELQAFVSKVMVRGTDYDVIPGTGDRPTLLQPGAQKLCEVYGFAAHFEDDGSVMEWEKGFFFFKKRCVLTARRDGRFIGDGVGSCNSREDRYAWRWVWDKPKGVDVATLKTRQTRNGKTQWRMPNEDIYSLVNTIEKMACKRALVHAVTGATRSSGVFTQDVEDLPSEVFGRADTTRSWAQGEAPSVVAHDPKARAMLLDKIAKALTNKALPSIAAEVVGLHRSGAIDEDDAAAIQAAYKARAAELKRGRDSSPQDIEPPDHDPTSDEDVAAAIDRGDA